MIIRFFVAVVLLSPSLIEVTDGYAGCSDPLIPCSNATHCVNVSEICLTYHNCNDGTGGKLTCHHCPAGAGRTIACVTQTGSHLSYECLSQDQICNGKKDCLHGEDEYACGIKQCSRDSWLCPKGTCIQKSRLCDKKQDCPDGADELQSTCDLEICGLGNIHCPTGECITARKKCNGVPDCPDGFDEKDCPTTAAPTSRIETLLTESAGVKALPMLARRVSVAKDSCSIPLNRFVCSTSQSSTRAICIPNDRVCDGYRDCPVGDDEIDCVDKCISDDVCPKHVSVTCLAHPRLGSLCRCATPGYQMTLDPSRNDRAICQDRDECSDSFGMYCSFGCVNTNGDFNCTCPADFILDPTTRSCRKLQNDELKPNLLVLFDDSIRFYHVANLTHHHPRTSSSSFTAITLRNNQQWTHLQYDPQERFIIYYDSQQKVLFCHSQTSTSAVALLSQQNIDHFAYDSSERILFVIDNLTRELRLYATINCDGSSRLKMHSWSLDHSADSIHGMEIDILHGQLIFASNDQFLVANISTPNITQLVYTSDRPIMRFIYDTNFQRIFWTASNTSLDELYPVFTCDHQFQQCHDTLVRLPLPWPFTFFDDGLIYTPLSAKSLDVVQLYGNRRFTNRILTTTKDHIRSLLPIHYRSSALANQCVRFGATLCPNQLCVESNGTMLCLSVDQTIQAIDQALIDKSDSVLESSGESAARAADPTKKSRIRSIGTKLLGFFLLGCLTGVLIVFGKRYRQRRMKRERHQDERRLTLDEPGLDEFNVIVDDRVSKEHVTSAGALHVENPSFSDVEWRSTSTKQSVALLTHDE